VSGCGRGLQGSGVDMETRVLPFVRTGSIGWFRAYLHK
jgi:hypothetical protein